MKVSKDTLEKCGFKRNRARIWKKKTETGLGDSVVLQYNPHIGRATVTMYEPSIVYIVCAIDVKNEKDFLDFSWEFYVKYIADNDYHHPDWNSMAVAHGRPDSDEIISRIENEKKERRSLFAEYEDYFGERFDEFVDDACVVRKKVMDKGKDDNVLKDCIDILFGIMNGGKISLFLSKEKEYCRSEFDIDVIGELLYEKGFSKEDIIKKYVDVYKRDDYGFDENDDFRTIRKKIENLSSGYSSTPFFIATMPYMKKDGDKIKMEVCSELISCKHYIEKIGETTYLRGYHYDIGDLMVQNYKKLKKDDDIVKILGVGVDRSIYEDVDFWHAGVKFELFDKF